jgi:hypothetical protein
MFGFVANRNARVIDPIARLLASARVVENLPSPSGEFVARIEHWDYGALGYLNKVYLSTASGWFEHMVFASKRMHIAWLDENRLEVVPESSRNGDAGTFEPESTYWMGKASVSVLIKRKD